ncbi:MAG: hypothetical protein ABI868_06410 [Acidobacteriota bacterium]
MPAPHGLMPGVVVTRAAGAVTTLSYLGKFSLPAGFAYSGRGLAFNAARNSLFTSGFTRSPLTAEVSIPAIGGTASVLQQLTDPTEGRAGQVNPGDPNDKVTGGYLVSGDRLLVSVYAYYDGAGAASLSHFVRPLSLSTRGQVDGPIRVGPLGAGFYAGYMADIPAEWRAALGGPALTGQAEISIISRTSYGPAAFAFDPENLNAAGAVPLVYYDSAHQNLGTYDHADSGVRTTNQSPYYGIADEISGVVFPRGTSSVLFFGRHSATTCYGEGAPCGDPTDSSKGTHGYPYQPVMLVYDANDLAAVKAGTIRPWDVTPVTKWVMPFTDPTGAYHISGAAYDPAGGRIYVGQYFTNGAAPVVHVFAVAAVPDAPAPAPAPTATLIAAPASIAAGGSATLTWVTTNASTVSINRGIGTVAASGTQVVAPTATTTYTLTATNAAGSVTATASVAVGSSPPVGGSAASPDGTTVPGAASVIDNALNVWTIGSGQVILRNGTPAGGGYGSQILWYQGVIYVLGTDANWWRWTGSAWSNVGPTSPSPQAPPPSGGSSASPDGTRVPGAASIIDNALNVWTIGSEQVILRNGAPAGGGYGSQILWYQGVVYVLGTDANWWRWTGSAWSIIGPTSPSSEGPPASGSGASPDGTRVPGAASVIDDALNVWTIGSGQAILRNGTQADGGWGTQILWYQGVVYVFGTDARWWRWTGSTWDVFGSSAPV